MAKAPKTDAVRTLGELTPSPKNPRKITDPKTVQLRKALEAFGDLSGVVFNRRSGQLVGGHQRTAVFKSAQGAAIKNLVILKTYEKPTKNGTVAEGYISAMGERFCYREVDWDEGREMAANLAANKQAGSFEVPEVADILRELRDFDLDLDVTMFDLKEREEMLQVSDFLPDEIEQPPRLDEKKMTLCPSCGHEF